MQSGGLDTGLCRVLGRVGTGVDAKPDVLNQNLESPRRVFELVRAKGDYRLSLDLLAKVKELDPGMVTKSGIIVGMGETRKELVEAMRDLRSVDCDLLTIGQYFAAFG